VTAERYSSDEMMAVAGARQISDGQVCLIGIGLPGTAALLAKHHHAPSAVLIYESGVLDTDPEWAPLSIGDDDLAVSSRAIVSLPEMFNYWLQGGRIDLGFLGAAQIDRYGNINTTVIGPYESPKVRLPGSGGAPEIAAFAGDIIVIMRHTTRGLVNEVDFVTSVGHIDGTVPRSSLGFSGGGPSRLVTDLGILTSHPDSREFVLTGIFPGIDVATVEERTGWELVVSPDVAELPEPSDEELRILRKVSARP
jgi:glutaconate CoA-transferase subunit B